MERSTKKDPKTSEVSHTKLRHCHKKWFKLKLFDGRMKPR